MNSNNEIIKAMVQNHFSFDKESLELFNKSLDNPEIDETYEEIGLGKDLRKRWKIDIKFYKGFDKGWKIFYSRYGKFIKKYNIAYEDFFNNKVLFEKNYIKIPKLLKNYIINIESSGYDHAIRRSHNLKILSDALHSNAVPEEIIMQIIKERLSLDCNIEFFNLISIRYMKEIYKAIGYNDIPKKDPDFKAWEKIHIYGANLDEIQEKINASNSIEIIKKLIGLTVDLEFEYIGENKLPKRELEIVLSCNFVDWFLCSTSESWSSCLNLESNYHYWSGLPALAVDKNRAMIYITDGTKKEYKGIETDKFLSRAWVILNDYGKMVPVRFYPNQYLEIDEILKITGLKNFFSVTHLINSSKNSIPFMRYYDGNTAWIFQDNTKIKLNPVGDTFYLTTGAGGIEYFAERDKEAHYGDLFNNIGDGLSYLIESGKELMDFSLSNSEVCQHCGRLVPTEETYLIESEDYVVCEACYESFYDTCSECGENFRYENLIEIDGSVFCEECANEVSTTCSDCGEMVFNRDATYIPEEEKFLCDDCIANSYYECDECSALHHKSRMVFSSVGDCLCENCAEEFYKKCSECGRTFHRKHLNKEGACKKCCKEKEKAKVAV